MTAIAAYLCVGMQAKAPRGLQAAGKGEEEVKQSH